MSQVLNMFSAENNECELTGIKALSKALRYHPDRANQFLSGLFLNEDLKSHDEVILYTAGTPITYKNVNRLLELQENHSGWDLHFKLKRSAELTLSFKNNIISKFKKLTEFRQNYKVYNTLLRTIAEELDSHIEEILSDENITLELYKMKYMTDSSECKGAKQFFNHTESVALFAFAISKTSTFKDTINFSQDEYRNMIKAALFHNIGAVLEVNSILKASQEKRKKLYHSANGKSLHIVDQIKMSIDALKSIQYMSDYYLGDTGFATHEDNSAIWMANIILVADQYLLLESGLFGDRLKPSFIIENLNDQAVNEKLNNNVVYALTQGLGMNLIGDYYSKMENIRRLSIFAGGGSAWPYPVKGFKSPSAFCMQERSF
jgi:hypothetical protein